MTAYYNEIEPFAVKWLGNLIKENVIADGVVDSRSIRDVVASDLIDFDQCHFFAGVGVWSGALRAAGWADDREIWTGSCPCQPFSQAGAGRGVEDERHLWPEFFRLIAEWRPALVLGEQVSGPAGRSWFDLVSADLEGTGYSTAAADLCSAGVGAPNIRQRLYWMADAESHEFDGCQSNGDTTGGAGPSNGSWLGDTESGGQRANGIFSGSPSGGQDTRQFAQPDKDARRLGYAGGAGLPHAQSQATLGTRGRLEGGAATEPSGAHDPWRELEWIACLDGKARPTEPGLFPLAARHPGDVGKLRAYGNALNFIVAREFIAAVMECLP